MSGEEKMPEGWVKVKSKSRPDKHYYYNAESKLSVWRVEDCKNARQVIAAANGQRPKALKKSPRKKPSKLEESSKPAFKRNIAEARMKKLKSALAEDTKRGNEDLARKETKTLKHSTSRSSNTDRKPAQSSKNDSNHAPVEESAVVTGEKSQNNLIDERMEVDEDSEKFEEQQRQLNDQVEPMDWEEIGEKEAVQEVISIRTKDYKAASVKCSPSKRINNSESEFYVIVDTNVLLSNLKQVREIKGAKYRGIGKAVVYLPYVVLCELDRLKMREGNVARLARAAINFIDMCFSAKDDFLIGQSAIESSREIISTIENGDDYIINSGLQLKEVTNKVIVLSNDTNLRNKAVVNELDAYSSNTLKYEGSNEMGNIKFK